MTDIIEISGSDEDAIPKPVLRRRSSSLSAIPFTAAPRSCSMRSFDGDGTGVGVGVESDVDRTHYRTPRKPELERARVRRIVYSSSSDSEEVVPPKLPLAGARHGNADVDDVIEITDSSDDDHEPLPARVGVGVVRLPLPSTPRQRHDGFDNDGLLVLNDPPSARTPLRRPQQTPRTRTASPDPPGSADKETHGLVRAFSTLSSLTTLPDSDSEKVKTRVGAAVGIDDPLAAVPPKTPLNAKSKSTTTPAKTTKTPRTSSKKALAQAEQAERAAYAQSLFDELNRTVFAGGLLVETTLVWSNRLLTTAGRAQWHRSKEGVQTTSIELATKILDSKERIQNTLSHEMCHLACWVINQDPKEGHGKAWKSWAAKVVRKRPDIDISTRHNYEISYPYEWECENCAKTYGRFSKSIRPDEVVCGACKTGTLHPLFTVRAKRSSKMTAVTANGRMAATSPRDSPRMAVPVGTGVRMPGSFGFDDDEAELDELVMSVRKLGVEG